MPWRLERVVYNNVHVRSAIEAARSRVAKPTASPVAPAGLRADRAMARAEVKQLREERDVLLAQVRRGLGTHWRAGTAKVFSNRFTTSNASATC
ncbi:hypothetical protein AGMMS50218_11840 [Actinomycetota bacterium]|nr:hypothetical protein AGMMS50218_11840 [Actinomycetota bacterium]